MAQGFAGKHRRDPELLPGFTGKPVLLAQECAHLGEQRILDGEREVGDRDARRVDLATGTTGGNQRYRAAPRPGDHGDLAAYLVNGVDQVVETPSEKAVDVLRRHEIVDFPDLAIRVDGTDALRHGTDLGFAEFPVDRMHLSVDVRFDDDVQVDQGDPADRRTRQALGRPRTDAADTDHRHMRLLKTPQGVGPVEARDAGEAAWGIDEFLQAVAVAADRRGDLVSVHGACPWQVL